MKLATHIANRFLTDPILIEEIMTHHQNVNIPPDQTGSNAATRNLMVPDGSTNYIVTETVIERLNYMKLTRPLKYQVLDALKDGKRTYILPKHSIVRYFKQGHRLHLCYLSMKNVSQKQNYGNLSWHIWYAHTDTGFCSISKFNTAVTYSDDGNEVFYGKFDESEIGEVEQMCYALLCFIQLTEVQEHTLPPGQRYGTKKHNKLVNDTRILFTIINSSWNITSIRSEGFSVRGHIALRWTGPGRTTPKLVLIEPFEKHGYIRKAKSLDEK